MPAINKKILEIIERPVFIVCMFALFLLIRLVSLHADPSPIKFQPEIIDEGFWIHNARNMALFGSWHIDDLVQQFVGAPLFCYLMFLSFKIFGVGFFSARLVSALSGWLTVLLVFLILKREFPTRTAVVGSAMIGLMGEFLTYNRIAFPESLQIMFITLAFYLWSLSEKRNYLSLACGISFALAFLSKISAYHVFPAIVVLWIFEWLSGRLKIRNMVSLSIGFTAVMLSWFFAFYIPNIALYRSFMATNGQYTLMTENYFLHFLNQCLTFIYNPFYAMPSITLLLFFLLPYFIGIIYGSIKVPKAVMKRLSFAEMMSLSWLIGGNISLILISDNSHRRYIMFIVPLVLLASIALVTKYRDMEKFGASIKPPIGISRYLILLILIYVFATSTGNLLSLSLILFVMSTAWASLYSRKHADFMAWAFIFSSLLIIPFAANIAFFLESTPLFVSDAFSRGLFVLIAFLLMAMIGQLMAGKAKRAIAVTLASFIAWNIFVLGAWVTKPSFTLYDASRSIAAVSGKGDIIVGSYCHLLSLENKTFPLWWSPNDVYQELINKDKVYKFYPKFMIYSNKTLREKNKRGYFMGINMFSNKLSDISVFRLVPFLFTDGFYRTFHFAELRKENK